MKKIILSISVLCASFLSTAQITVTGVSPSPIVANYGFTWADNWGATPNFNTPGVFVQDTLMLISDGTSGLNAQGNPISAQACAGAGAGSPGSPPGPGTWNDLTGKIAVIYRNTCDFSYKAYRAQLAGAVGVIILNRDNEVVPMGAGDNASLVTIPVVMLSSSDGLILTNEMLNGPVVVFMGNKIGLYPNDMTISINTTLVPKAAAFPSQLAQNGTEFNFDLGTRVYNFGTLDQSNVTIRATIDGPSGNVYDETVTLPTILSGDSIDVDPTSALTFPQFSLASYPAGLYTLSYTVDLGVADDFTDDNMVSTDFTINNNLLSYARLDANNVPVADNFYRSSTATQSYSACIAFRDANASRLGVDGFYFSATTNRVLSPSIEGEQLSYFVYKWNNVFTNLDDAAYAIDDFESVAFGSYLFEADLQDTTLYSPLDQQIVLEDNQRYLFCLQTYSDSIYLGYDTKNNYDWNVGYYLEAVCPVESNGVYNGVGFGGDVIPAIGIKVFNADQIGLKEFATVAGSAYPNPTSDKVTVSVSTKGTGVLTITDVSGRVAYSGSINLNSGKADVNTSQLNSGMYIFNIDFDNGQNSKFNVVKN